MHKRNVVLVDINDRELGVLDIFEAHKNPGKLHRAISVVLFNSQGKLLLQQRSKKKLLWPEHWSNTVCTHPFENETYEACAVRRLDDELGIRVANGLLRIAYRFEYQADYSTEWSEHELDTVLVGKYEGEIKPNPDEVMDYRWISIDDLEKEMGSDPDKFTPWFKMIINDRKLQIKKIK